ncbi:type I-E CRISPR-associated endoribonuclease Cas2e [Pseudarthrobacter sp. AB1]|uniref:type I-E CRISPR-associated endoribonuclease Cas2e n=1 Tax=Pseudarthrobacter sp. AB1 TaxID=2138309 RepID=UPI00186B869A|nr:type I-E CRISPR-associated endoribonuclease Cas2e [Pseudarthrobacter sp. AB1]MBE4719515.1 type I-E CRISPR-associated endoribonuclease Cas2 [Pseudarthrobacter sp. AB1]
MIAVVVTRAVPDHLRGYIGRFLTEVVPGVFVGRTSRAVADRIWERTSLAVEDGASAIVLTDASREQGYEIRTAGSEPPNILDVDGLHLVGLVGPLIGREKTEGVKEST